MAERGRAVHQSTPPGKEPAAELPLSAASRRLRERPRKGAALQRLSTTPRRFDIRRALQLRMRGYSLEALAAHFGVPRSTLHERLRGIFEIFDPDRVQAYEQNRVALLSAIELETLGLLADPDKRDKASLNNAAFTFTQVFNARRLEGGQSTANLALHELVEQVEREHARKRRRADALPNGNDDGNETPK